MRADTAAPERLALCHTLDMRTVGRATIAGPSLAPSAAGLAAARVHQNTGAALAAIASTGIRHGVYRFSSHEEMNRASDEALARVIRMNANARGLLPAS